MSGGEHWYNGEHLHSAIRFVPPNSLLRLAGLNWPVPNFSTLCRRQKTLAVQIPYPTLGHVSCASITKREMHASNPLQRVGSRSWIHGRSVV